MLFLGFFHYMSYNHVSGAGNGNIGIIRSDRRGIHIPGSSNGKVKGSNFPFPNRYISGAVDGSGERFGACIAAKIPGSVDGYLTGDYGTAANIPSVFFSKVPCFEGCPGALMSLTCSRESILFLRTVKSALCFSGFVPINTLSCLHTAPLLR